MISETSVYTHNTYCKLGLVLRLIATNTTYYKPVGNSKPDFLDVIMTNQ